MTANDMATRQAHAQQLPQHRSYASFTLKSRRSNVNVSSFDISDNESSTLSKSAKRESRLGLKNIFGRPKHSNHSNHSEDQLTPLGPDERASMVRLQAADRSRSPYSNQQISSESTLSTSSLSNSRHSEASNTNYSRTVGSLGRSSTRRKTTQQDDAQLSAEYPPLFQAYPQAIKQATLSATTTTADVILQQSHEKNLNADQSVSDPAKHDKLRKKHGKNGSASFQWTTKIYLLTSTGSILQYGAHSHYSSPPEKVLKLSDASAAFVTDAIPGQHWVLQISSDVSQTEAEVNSDSSSRSLFSKLTHGSSDNRFVSNMFLVFENAAEMDIWIALVRAEIDRLKAQKLARTASAHRSNSFAACDQPPSLGLYQWEQTNQQDPDATITVADFDAMQDHSTDDASTTNSVVSQDSRQLDNLRESTARLSLTSSGQRTMGSSLSTSPILDSFSRKSDELHSPQDGDELLSVKSRPNATVISQRRASMQPGGVFGTDEDATARRHARSKSATHSHSRTMSHEIQYVYPKSTSHSRSSTLSQEIPNITPNFSVPTSSSRRFSHSHSRSRSTSSEVSIPSSPQLGKPAIPQRAPRGKPPTSLKSSRPLSMVADQPSPLPIVAVGPSTSRGDGSCEPQLRSEPFDSSMMHKRMPSEDDMPIPRSKTTKSLSRAKSNIGLVLRHGEPVERHDHVASDQPSHTIINAPVYTWGDQKKESRLSVHPNSNESNRISLRPPPRSHRRQISSDATLNRPPPMMAPPPTAPLPPLPTGANLRASLVPKPLQTRKSMPHVPGRALPYGASLSYEVPPVPQR